MGKVLREIEKVDVVICLSHGGVVQGKDGRFRRRRSSISASSCGFLGSSTDRPKIDRGAFFSALETQGSGMTRGVSVSGAANSAPMKDPACRGPPEQDSR